MEPDPAIPVAGMPKWAPRWVLSPWTLPVLLGNKSPNNRLGWLNPSLGTARRGWGVGHRCCGSKDLRRPSGTLASFNWGGWPCSPMPASPTCVHALLSCTRHRASSITVHTPSSCILHHLARSTFVRAPSLCTLHHLTRSITSHTPSPHTLPLHVCSSFAGASSSYTLHHCAHAVVQASSLCKLLHLARFIVMYGCHAHSIILHTLFSHVLCYTCSIMYVSSCAHSIVHSPLSYPHVATENSPKLWGGRVGSAQGSIPITGAWTPSPWPLHPAHPWPARVNAGGEGCLRALVPVQK